MIGSQLRVWSTTADEPGLLYGHDPGWRPSDLTASGVLVTPDGPRWFTSISEGDGLWLEADVAGGMPSARSVSILEILEQSVRAEREVTRLSQELTNRYEEIDLLYAISEILGHTVQLQQAAQTIVRAVASVVGARRASILLLDPTGQELRTVAAQGIPPGRAGVVRVDDPVSIAARVIREHRPLIGDPIEGAISSAGGEERGYQGVAFMSVPICYSAPGGKHRCIGVINLTDRIGGDSFVQSDRKLVTAIANQVGAALENARLAEREREQQRLKRELELAQRLQQTLMPSPTALQGDALVGVRCMSLESVGGDFYGLRRLGRGAVAVMVGDVSSHGFSAALLMASVVAAAGVHADASSSPSEILNRLHDSLAEQLNSAESHVTVFYGVLDPANARLVFANAGHGHAFRVPMSGDPKRLEATAPPVGLGSAQPIEAVVEPWKVGTDLLCVWTDGITDAANGRGERFGESRVLEALVARRHLPPEQIVEQVLAAVDGFAPHPVDDRTLLVLKI